MTAPIQPDEKARFRRLRSEQAIQLAMQNKWEEADGIRRCLMNARIIIEDTKEGSQWRYAPE